MSVEFGAKIKALDDNGDPLHGNIAQVVNLKVFVQPQTPALRFIGMLGYRTQNALS